MLKFDELPALPENDRIMVLPDRVKKVTDGGIEIPDQAKRRANYGVILAAGLKATDVLHDNGGKVGDRIWFGQYAGVIEQWDHITKAGKKADCEHDWVRAPELYDIECEGHRCACGAIRMKEPLLVMNVGDILANVDKAARLRSGEVILTIGVTLDGKTQHTYSAPQCGQSSTLNGGTTHAS